jgi:hypothetical protein
LILSGLFLFVIPNGNPISEAGQVFYYAAFIFLLFMIPNSEAFLPKMHKKIRSLISEIPDFVFFTL